MSLSELKAELAATRKRFKKIVEKVVNYRVELEAFDAHMARRLPIGGTILVRFLTIREDVIPRLTERGVALHGRITELKQEISRVRQQERCKLLEQEIIAAAFHPRRVERLLDQGGHECVDATLGC